MINIEISKEDFQRPEVYSAVIRLLETINGTPTSAAFNEPAPIRKRANARRASEQVGTPLIDEQVRAAYQDTISKAKSLFFLSTIKRLGVAELEAASMATRIITRRTRCRTQWGNRAHAPRHVMHDSRGCS